MLGQLGDAQGHHALEQLAGLHAVRRVYRPSRPRDRYHPARYTGLLQRLCQLVGRAAVQAADEPQVWRRRHVPQRHPQALDRLIREQGGRG